MIIIPTYNERKNIRPLVGRIRALLPDIRIFFVDDNSPDGTGDEIKSLQALDKNIHLLARPGKAGFASAYLDGFKFAQKEFDPEFVVTMDSDLSHPPEKLPELIKIAQEGKVAVGSRYTPGGAVSNWKLKRKILSRLANFYARVLLKLPLSDVTSGFMTIPKPILNQLNLNTIQNKGYAFLMELKHNMAELDAQFVEVPIIFEERIEGVSKLGSGIIVEGIKYPASNFFARQLKENYLPWLIFLGSLTVFMFTLPHTIFFGDSAEFMASVATVGIPHPSGYPAYVLLAKLFTFLPFGNPEFRIGLFSAFCAALTLAVFYFLFLKIAKVVNKQNVMINQWTGLVTTLIFGFSALFWSQAIMAKVYIPVLLCILLIFLLFAKFWESSESKYLVAALFLFGFGTGFHEMILLFLPLIIFVVLVQVYKLPNIFSRRYKLKPIVLGLGLFILGLCIYLYLPIRAHIPGNYYDFSKIFRTSQPGQNITGFIDYVSRSDYADSAGKFIWTEKIAYFNSFFINLWQQFYWLLIFAALGLVQLWLHSKKFFALTVLAFLLNVLAIILVRTSTFNYENEFIYSFYYLPAYSMAALWIGLGILDLFQVLGRFTKPRILIAIFLIALILPILLLKQNYPTNNLSHFTFVDDYSTKVLKSMPPNALLLVYYVGAATDTVTFGLHYEQIVNHIRPDVTILTTSDIYPQLKYSIIASIYGLADPNAAKYYLLLYTTKAAEYKDRPIYTTYPVDDLPKKVSWASVSNGLVYKFYPRPPLGYDEPDIQLDYNKDLAILNHDLYGQDLIAQYFYAQAAYWAGQKDLAKTQSNFINAIKYDYKVDGVETKAFMFYRARVFGKL